MTAAIAQSRPAISIDTKKKELVGEYANGGREWAPKGEPVAVNVHDFPDKTLGKAIPYGIYDIGADNGFVNVGITKETAGVRGRLDPQLVAAARPGALPGCQDPADHRRLRWLELQSHAVVEGRAAAPGQRHRP